MNKKQQTDYIANVAFADALGSCADYCDQSADPDDRKLSDKLHEDGFAGPCQELTHEALRYKMQQQFVDYAKALLDKVEDSPHWQFLMDVATDKGKREALYLLYMTAVGHGVGFWDTTHKWSDFCDVTDAPEQSLQSWAEHFTHGNVLNVKGKPYTGETPMVNWPLRDARPHRKAP